MGTGNSEFTIASGIFFMHQKNVGYKGNFRIKTSATDVKGD